MLQVVYYQGRELMPSWTQVRRSALYQNLKSKSKSNLRHKSLNEFEILSSKNDYYARNVCLVVLKTLNLILGSFVNSVMECLS